jgi:Phage protein Gp138 N-terminal domain
MPTGEINLEELITLAVETGIARVNTSLPGTVVSYDAATQRADIRPGLNRIIHTAEGAPVSEALPILRAVRVVHPGGKDWALHIPLKEGDTVGLIVSQADPTGWQTRGEVSDPRDRRLHSLAHVWAVPGWRTDNAPIPGASADYPTWSHKDGFKVTLKSDGLEVGGATDAAALASKVNALSEAFAAHTHLFVGTGSVSTVNPAFVHSDTASTKLKVSG